MRVFLFLMVFSLILAGQLKALEIEGSLSDDTKDIIKNYYENFGRQKTSRLLESLGYSIYHFENSSLKIKDTQIVKQIIFKGNYIFLDSTLKNAGYISTGDSVNRSILDNSLKRIEQFYFSRGYRNAKVTYSYENGKLTFTIDEGKLFFVTDIAIKGADYPESLKLITSEIFNKDLLEKYKAKIEEYYRDQGYFNVTTNISYTINKKNKLFININDPLISVLSILPNFHQGVALEINVNKGKHYNISIEGVETPNIKNTIIKLVNENLKQIDSYNIRSTESILEAKLTEKGFIFPEFIISLEGNTIQISFKYSTLVNDIQLNIHYERLKKNSFKDTFKIPGEALFTKNKNRIKDVIVSFLANKGYLNAAVDNIEFTLKDNKLTADIKISEGNIYIIDRLYVNDLLIDKNINIKALKTYIPQLKEIIYREISSKYHFNYMAFSKYRLKTDKKADIIFQADISKLILENVICENKNIKESVKSVFENDKTIVKTKLTKIKDFILRQKNYKDYRMEVIPKNDKKADIVIAGTQGDLNEVFGGFSYDNIDKIRIFAGYRRYDFFDTAHQLEIITNYSNREKSLNISLSGYKKFSSSLSESYYFNWKDRDESTYEYIQKRTGAKYTNTNPIGKYSYGLYFESLNFSSLDFTGETKNKINTDFRLLAVPLSAKLSEQMPDDPFKIDYSFSLDVTPVFQIDKPSFAVTEINSELKTNLTKNLRLLINADAGYNTGNLRTTPLTYRFTLGGPYRMRAFDYRDIGSQDKQGNVYGGNLFYYTLFGIDYRVFNNIYFGPFVEYGNASESFNISNGYSDIGVALKANTPIGDLGLSFAYETSGSKKSDYAFYLTISSTF